MSCSLSRRACSSCLFLASAASARVTAVSASARREASFCFRNDSGDFLLVACWLQVVQVTCLLDLFHEDDDGVVRNRDIGPNALLGWGGGLVRDRDKIFGGQMPRIGGPVPADPATRPLWLANVSEFRRLRSPITSPPTQASRNDFSPW